MAITLPWESKRAPDPNKDYLLVLAYLPLTRLRTAPRFWRYIQGVREQLKTADGLIGYSLRTNPLRGWYWTLSVWEGDGALMGFVRGLPHREVMSEFAPRLGAFRLLRWKVPGSSAQVTWDDALRRLAAESASGP